METQEVAVQCPNQAIFDKLKAENKKLKAENERLKEELKLVKIENTRLVDFIGG